MDRTETLEKVIDVVRETLDLDDSVELTEGTSVQTHLIFCSLSQTLSKSLI